MFLNMSSELFYTCTTALWFSYYKKKKQAENIFSPKVLYAFEELRGAIGDNNTFT